MWKIAFCLLVLVLCMEMSAGGKWKRKMDQESASNPELMAMMRMKKVLAPLRQLFSKVLDLGPEEYLDGQPEFCRDRQCPSFTVVNQSSHYELRNYQPSTWIRKSVTAKAWSSDVQTKLFWPLFDYIKGKNDRKEKIEMTVPVITTVKPVRASKGKLNITMAFFLPPSVSQNPPVPADNELFVVNRPAQMVYVHSFKGFAYSHKIWKKHAVMLTKHLKKDSCSYVPMSLMLGTAGYNEPDKLFNRHNEVWLWANKKQ